VQTARKLTLILAALVAACGPKQTGPTIQPDTPQPPPGQQAAQDQPFEYAAEAVSALYFQPEALSTPSMEFKVSGGRKIADQRKRYKKAKGEERTVEGDALAVLLWQTGKDADRKEAQAVYRELVTGGAASEGVLQRSAFVEALRGEEAEAAKRWDELVTRFATSASAPVYRAYKAYHQLRAGDNAGAAATMTDVSKGDADPAEVAYVAGWIAFRKGDQKAAWQSVVRAAKKWTEAGGLAALRRDVMLFASRGDADPDVAVNLLGDLAKKDGADHPVLVVALADAYKLAGRYDRRAETYDILAKSASPAALATIRYHQADVEYRMNRPDKAADRALAAWDAASKAKDLDAPTREALAKFVYTLGAVDHATYAQCGYDADYGDAGKKLYAAYVTIPDRPDTAEAKTRASDLDATIANTEVQKNGLHDQNIMRTRVLAHLEEIASCYERTLQGSPQLAGAVKVTIDVVESGEVTAVATDPAGGADGLGAVAACLSERIKGWTFPSRTRPGLTRMILPLDFARAAEK
jgi:tetratricopeptide (TPR) repeat protein